MTAVDQAGSSVSLPQMSRLTPGNYLLWKILLESALAVQQVKYLLTFDLAPNMSQEEKTKYVLDNERANLTILSTVSESEIVILSGCGTARDMWSQLIKKYGENPLTDTQCLRRQQPYTGRGCRCECDLDKIMNTVAHLRAAGAEISDPDLNATILASLPISFESAVAVLEGRKTINVYTLIFLGKLA